MSHQCSLSELNENLVPFTARQIKSSLIWCAEDVRNPDELQNACSYIIDPGSTASAKVFHAERYGGSGIQRNGGGARCGFDGNYQVKGIGSNPLVGEGTDERHSNGALGAVHAIYEALWGEVLAQILPYSAVRVRAVLLTDLYTEKAFECSGRKSRRALLVREPVVRPAHFERAPYFQVKPEYSSLLIHDACRVRSVIHKLPGYLPVPPEEIDAEARTDPRIYCIEGLCELARREAWQMAFCRTRFLRLTTSPSNIAMDGRLMDFSGLSCLFPGDSPADFGYKLRLAELAKEPMVLMQGLSDLCLYIGKYMFDPDFTLAARLKVEEIFQKTFHEACYYCYLELLGIPGEFITQKEIPDILKELVNSFVALLNKYYEKSHAQDIVNQDGSPLQKLVVTLIHHRHNQKQALNSSIKNDVYFTVAQQCFSQAIHWLTQGSTRRQINASLLLKEIEHHTMKRLQPREELRKENMCEKIAILLDNHGDDPLFLQEAISDMKNFMLKFSRDAFGYLEPIRNTV
ncbi:MchC protein [Escherichia coli O6:H1]